MKKSHSGISLNITQKTKTILDSPQLPQLIQTLSTRTLANLINTVGIEESHAIALHVSNEQIKQVLDLQLWNSIPGEEETLSVDNFFPWLELWNELGAEYVAEKLQSLGEDFAVVCFSRHITAVNTQVVGLDSLGLDFGKFDVIPKKGVEDVSDEEQWIVLVETLNHLHDISPDFLASVLQRCSFVRSILQEDTSENFVASELERDLGYAREIRSEQEGFITTTDAFAFLSIARTAPLEKIISTYQYDGLTRRYFKLPRLEQDVDLSVDQMVEGSNGNGSGGQFNGNQASAVSMHHDDVEELRRLKDLLVDMGVKENPGDVLLIGYDATAKVSTSQLLDNTMNLLKLKSELIFEKRYAEMMYLSNVLIAGVGLRGAKFSRENGAKAVRATCNLGFEYLVTNCGESQEELYLELLSAEPGMLRPFQLGLRLLNQIPENCAEQLGVFLSSKKLGSRLARLPWIAAELEGVLNGSFFADKVKKRQFEELKQNIRILSLIIDPVAEHALVHLIDEFPVFPKIITMNPQPIRKSVV